MYHLIGQSLSCFDVFVCACAYLEIVSILQGEALSSQPDSFALFSGDAIDTLVVVIIVWWKVGRKENAFRSQWGGSTLRCSKKVKRARTVWIKITVLPPNYLRTVGISGLSVVWLKKQEYRESMKLTWKSKNKEKVGIQWKSKPY